MGRATDGPVWRWLDGEMEVISRYVIFHEVAAGWVRT